MYAAILFSLLLIGCASVESVDRSIVSSPLMQFTETELDSVAPHTGLRGSGTSTAGGCTVCAH